MFKATSGCIESNNDVTVKALVAPEVQLPIGEEIELGDSIQIVPFGQVGVEPFIYSWSALFGDPNISCPDCPEPFMRPFESTLYNLDFTDTTGCIVSDTILIKVDPTLFFFPPNAFTPNGDGTNDEFRLFSSRPYLLKMFAVLDRWGNILHREEDVRIDAMQGWDGMTAGEMMSPGTYVWYAIFDLPDGTEVPQSGDINLIR